MRDWLKGRAWDAQRARNGAKRGRRNFQRKWNQPHRFLKNLSASLDPYMTAVLSIALLRPSNALVYICCFRDKARAA